MTTPDHAAEPPARPQRDRSATSSYRLAWRLARRDLRGGLRPFRVFLACLAIGVAAIAAVGSVNQAVVGGLRADARTLLGGDVDLRLVHRPTTPAQDQWLTQHAAELSRVVEMRAMARPQADETLPTLVELKAVDDSYPLIGSVELSPPVPLRDALERREGVWGAAADAAVLERLGAAVGDRLHVGDATFVVRAVVEREPDRVASVFNFGPRLMIAAEALAATGLVQPGSLIRYHTRVLLPPGDDVSRWTDALKAAFPAAGWRIRDASGAAPGVERFVSRMTMFLTFVGMSALLVGGIGISNAVRAYLGGKTATIATFKCLGAPGGLVFLTYLLQIGILAGIGIGIGLVLGAGLPAVGLSLLEGQLPVHVRPGIYPGPLALAALFGLLTALVFALWPLAQARDVPAANLFRTAVAPASTRPSRPYLAALAAAAAALAGLTVVTAEDHGFAAIFVAGAVASLALLYGGAVAVKRLAARLPRLGRPAWRMAVANLHRPAAPTAPVMVSLGIGLAALVAVTLIEGAIRAQIHDRMPESAPAFFFIDIQDAQAADFDATIAAVPGVEGMRRVPSVRGRIVRIAGVPVEQVEVAPEAQWAVRGDRGLTTAAEPPEHTEIVGGRWWQPDYDGPPLVSLDAGIARGFGVGIGDQLTLNVLGREITVTIASLREIDWQSIPFDFVMILSPETLAGAPITHIAAVFASEDVADAVDRAVASRFPNITAVRVREALDAVNGLIGSIGHGIRAAGAITVVAGLLVLAGAMAADRQRRSYDAVVFKVLGASRTRLARLYLAEYGLLGLATGILATGIGAAASWAVTEFVMATDWVFLPGAAAGVVILAVGITIVVGFAGTWRVLGRKAAPYLRNE